MCNVQYTLRVLLSKLQQIVCQVVLRPAWNKRNLCGRKRNFKMQSIFKLAAIVSVAAATLLTGCATSQKIQVVQPGDSTLSCGAIKTEITKLDASQAEIDSKKGITGTNVAAALFWLPGLAYTYYDAGEAQRLISDRKSAITMIYNNKKCSS